MALHVNIRKEVFNPVYLPYLDNRDRYLIFYGGGSSGKSYFLAQRYIYRLLKEPVCNLLVVRQTGLTHRQSTFPLLKQVINGWNLRDHFKVNESDMRIRCLANGNEVTFVGLDDVEKIKSITFESGELTDIWVEEATETRQEDINQLKIRLRGGTSSKQMVLSFNPVNVNHWIREHFFLNRRATICFTTYRDNCFLSDADRQALEDMRFVDEYHYRVYCLGQWGVLGKTVFDDRAIQNQLEALPGPVDVGYFRYRDDGLRLTDIQWVSDPQGCIRLYEQPGDGPYCIGGDTAGDGSDWFVAQVLDAASGRQAAVLRHQFDPDLYVRQVYCLGIHFGTALVGIETNFDTYPPRELQRLGYPNQYRREVADTYTGRLEHSFGFRTTAQTRPAILSELIRVVRQECETIRDAETLQELLTIVRNERGRIEAPYGGHDDLTMALAIAHQVRTQVVFPPKPKPKPAAWWPFAKTGQPRQQV